jgi:hypothetical protein
MVPRTSDPHRPTYCFSLTAAADPGLMPRVMQQFARRNLVPSQWHSALAGPRGQELVVDIQMEGIEAAEAERLTSLFRELVGVTWVAMSEKAVAKRA